MSGTSNIGLRYFSELAKQSGDGTIRFSENDERLVNKGAIGNKVVTVVGHVRRLFGAEDTRGERNQRAIEGFRESLKASYGTFGEQALNRLGVIAGSKLKGTDVLQAIELAEQLRGNSNNNELLRHRDPDLYRDVYDQAEKVLQEKRPNTVGINLDMLVGRVAERCRFESDLYAVKLSDEAIKRLAGEEAKQMLATLDDLGPALTRNNLRDRAQSVLGGIADQAELQRVLDDVGEHLRDLNAKGEISVVGDERTQQYTKAMFARLISDGIKDHTRSIDPKLANELGKLQYDMLQPDSTLRKAYEASIGTRRQPIIEGLVEAMARVLGPITHTPEGDLDRLKGKAEVQAPEQVDSTSEDSGWSDDDIILKDDAPKAYDAQAHDAKAKAGGTIELLPDDGNIVDESSALGFVTVAFLENVFDPQIDRGGLRASLKNLVSAQKDVPDSGDNGAARFRTELARRLDSEATTMDELKGQRDRLLEEESDLRLLYGNLSDDVTSYSDQASRAMVRAIEDLVRGLCAALNEAPGPSLEKLRQG